MEEIDLMVDSLRVMSFGNSAAESFSPRRLLLLGTVILLLLSLCCSLSDKASWARLETEYTRYSSAGDIARARRVAENMLSFALRDDSSEHRLRAGLAYSYLGLCASRSRAFAEAESLYVLAVPFLDDEGDTYRNLAVALFQYLGHAQSQQGRYRQSVTSYERALQLQREASNPTAPAMSALLVETAKACEWSRLPSRALAYYRDVLRLEYAAASAPTEMEMYSLFRTIDLLVAMDSVGEANREVVQVAQRISKSDSSTAWHRVSLLLASSEVLKAAGKCREAYDSARQSVQLAASSGLEDYVQGINVLLQMSESALCAGFIDSATSILEEAALRVRSDSLSSAIWSLRLAELSADIYSASASPLMSIKKYLALIGTSGNSAEGTSRIRGRLFAKIAEKFMLLGKADSANRYYSLSRREYSKYYGEDFPLVVKQRNKFSTEF